MSLRIGGYAAIVGGLLWLSSSPATPSTTAPSRARRSSACVIVVATVHDPRRPGRPQRVPVAPPSRAGLGRVRHPGHRGRRRAAGDGAHAIVGGDSDAEVIGGLAAWAISTLGVLTLLVGSALFALATWRARSLSRGAAALLGVGALLVLPALMGVTRWAHRARDRVRPARRRDPGVSGRLGRSRHQRPARRSHVPRRKPGSVRVSRAVRALLAPHARPRALETMTASRPGIPTALNPCARAWWACSAGSACSSPSSWRSRPR